MLPLPLVVQAHYCSFPGFLTHPKEQWSPGRIWAEFWDTESWKIRARKILYLWEFEHYA